MIKKLFYLILGCLVLIIITICTIGSARYNSYIEQKLITLARTANIPISIQGFRFGLPTLHVSQLNTKLPLRPIPLAITAENITFTPSYFSFLTGSKSLQLAGTLYSGTLETALNYSSTEKSTIAFKLNNIMLAEHPQIAGMGIKSGTLSVRSEELAFDKQESPTGALDIALSNFSTTGAITLEPSRTNLPLPLVIPPLANGALQTTLRMKPGRIDLADLSFTSTWGTFTGTGQCALDGTEAIRAFKAELHVSLSAVGLQYFGSYLPLLGNQLTAQQREFRLILSGFPLQVIGDPL